MIFQIECADGGTIRLKRSDIVFDHGGVGHIHHGEDDTKQ